MNEVKPRERRSRFSIEPIKGEDGKILVVLPRELTDYDLDIFDAIHRRRVATSDTIGATIGGYSNWISKRLSFLKCRPMQYVRITTEQMENQKKNLYSKLFWELAPAGVSALRARRNIKVPTAKPVRRLRHTSMQGEVDGSWEIGFAKSKTHGLISWNEHLQRDKTPEKLRKSGSHVISLSFDFDGKPVEHDYQSDGPPHGIRRPDGKAYFIFKEIDCHTESIRSDSDVYASVKRKLVQQITILERELFRTHYGFPNAYFAYYAPTDERLESIMELLAELTEDRPWLRKNFVFQRHLTYADAGYDQQVLTGAALTGDYMRYPVKPTYTAKNELTYDRFNFTE